MECSVDDVLISLQRPRVRRRVLYRCFGDYCDDKIRLPSGRRASPYFGQFQIMLLKPITIIAIRLRYNYDEKLTCSFFARVELRRMEAGARDTRSRIVVVS